MRLSHITRAVATVCRGLMRPRPMVVGGYAYVNAGGPWGWKRGR